ncbi:ABC transporter permease [Cellulomonas alba]|uniref:Transport permease protein n=1 Tax=Cellulomonas alba TaxID=3053467 RepID=A0ABT7SDU8_9CELL|nr:ABC transporter permease [Cellulomonas alba]MDM7854358.1 ABC transporter permease [Cellulomonas alba]
MSRADVAGAERTRPALPGTVRLAGARVGYELRAYFRERDAVVFIFAYPVIMLAIFASVFGKDDATVGPGVPFTQYFLPGMIATGVMLSSFQNIATSIAVERDQGSLKRLRGTPLPSASYFLGKVGQVLVATLLQTGLLLAAAGLLFGVDLPTSAEAWLTFSWVFVLGIAAGTLAGVAFSSVPRTSRSATAVVVPIVLVLQFISGVFFVFNDLPSWMQAIASVFPLKWLAQGMRSVFLPAGAEAFEVSGSWQHGLTAVVLVVWSVASLLVAVRTFRWLRRDES